MLPTELEMLLITDEIDESVELSPSVGTIVVESASPDAEGEPDVVVPSNDTDVVAVAGSGSAFQGNGLSDDGVLNTEL